MSTESSGISRAKEDFRQARRQAHVKQALSHLTGEQTELLSYDEVQKGLKLQGQIDRGLQEIPLDAIVGSVGRYRDFSRDFLPLSSVSEERWARVKAVATDGSGWPPIEVYQVGEAYFVLDGNHRVSVARQLDMETIPAYVTEVKTKVPLSKDAMPDELIIKTQYADFLDRTKLDDAYPNIDLTVTAPGAYREIDEQIALWQYMKSEEGQDVAYAEAATAWYADVYSPAVRVIRERGLLRDFPDRTETDLFIWLSRNRAEIEKALEWDVSAEEVADELIDQYTPKEQKKSVQLGKKVRRTIVPPEFEPGPPPGTWRAKRLATRREESLFHDILVPVSGEEAGWHAVEQAVVVAQNEDGQLRGLHVVPSDARRPVPQTQAVRERFDQMCLDAGVNGRLIVETGHVAETIYDRARWNDLIVLNVLHPPSAKMIDRMGSGLRQVIQHSPRPLLAARRVTSPLSKALLAYDGSPKAEEGLFLAAYFAQKWGTSLVVIVVKDKGVNVSSVQVRARDYLAEQGVEAEIVAGKGKAAGAILATAESHGCDFLIMGGYGSKPLVETVLGSVTDKILRQTTMPIFICK